LVLSFSQVPALFTFLAVWAQEERAIPLTCRILLFMLKTHQRQIVSSRQMKGMLEDVRGKLRHTLVRQKSEMGFNLAGLRVLGRRIREAVGESEFVDEETWHEGIQKGRKREFVNIA
jgi:U3 small nucleolar RNA-associated protein 12